MSHFTELEIEFDVKCQKELVETLVEVFGAEHVKTKDEGLPLYGYTGDNRSNLMEDNPNYAPLCEIVVRRQGIGHASNDMGFKKMSNGKFKAYVSEYDVQSTYPKFKGKMSQGYATRVSEKNLKAKGYSVKKTTLPNGVIQITAFKY